MRKLALVLLLTSTLSHKVTGETKTLDQSPNTVDDCYTNCRDTMLQVVTGRLLGAELNATEEFNKAWSANVCQNIITGGATIHTNALEAFGHNEKLRTTFNDAVHTLGGNASVYNRDFQFKSLHFLLMDALRLLKAEECKTVYHRSEHKYKADVGAEVRFGRFITAELELIDVIEDAVTVFEIISCSAVNLYDNACRPERVGTWLISPAESFIVESTKEIENDDGDKYTSINLRNSKTDGEHDCYYFQRPPASPSAAGPTGRSSDIMQLSSSMFGLMALFLSAALSMGSDYL